MELNDDNEVTQADKNPAKDRAVSNPNAFKAQQSHILSVAVGDGVNDDDSLDRIIDVSGDDVFSGVGEFDITQDDVYRVPNFDDLEEALRDAAFQLCAPSVNIRKLVDMTPDPNPDPNDLDDLVPAPDWSLTAVVDPIHGLGAPRRCDRRRGDDHHECRRIRDVPVVDLDTDRVAERDRHRGGPARVRQRLRRDGLRVPNPRPTRRSAARGLAAPGRCRLRHRRPAGVDRHLSAREPSGGRSRRHDREVDQRRGRRPGGRRSVHPGRRRRHTGRTWSRTPGT